MWDGCLKHNFFYVFFFFLKRCFVSSKEAWLMRPIQTQHKCNDASRYNVINNFPFYIGSAQSYWRRRGRWRRPSSDTSFLSMGSVRTLKASSWSTWRPAPWRPCWPPSRCLGSSASASSMRLQWEWTSSTAWIHHCSTWTWSPPTSCWTPTITSR